ncbi:MAG: hypothetical protein SPLUMA2_SPLUMAMAG2_00538 [uncultured Sulfurimonas sp.]|nr:MAG: hypothetical protein SPLUMA1_SPLUMAMAG1_01077 [uncultured Sulfurimonas sp.]CAI6155279.1 MAG: hypothetical protein SPLUMA2_SPLUMAMAG2_00538 [uncultured Sulfurimonas sp.]
MKTETQVKSLKNYTEFQKIISTSPEQERQKKIKANTEYIEYIKEHDKEAYKNYLSYSTYLKV